MARYIKAVAVQGKAQNLIEDEQTTSGTTWSSEKIKDSWSYTTSEKDTGKTWIDGKQIFSKTFVYQQGTYTTNFSTQINIGSNVDTVIDISGIFKRHDNAFSMHIPYHITIGSDYYQLYIYCDSTKIYYSGHDGSGNAGYYRGNHYITIEYTKI